MGFYFDNFIFLMEIECAVCLSEDGETLPHLQSCCLDAHTECTNSHCGEFAAHLWTNRLRNRRAFIALSPPRSDLWPSACTQPGRNLPMQQVMTTRKSSLCLQVHARTLITVMFTLQWGSEANSSRPSAFGVITAASVCSIQKINDAFFTWNICSDRFLFYKQFA